MLIAQEFTVPLTVANAYEVLTDLPRIAPCLPGATLTGAEGDTYQGTVKVKVGPMVLAYRGEVAFTDRDPSSGMATLLARGTESKGSGDVTARIELRLKEAGDVTVVRVETELAITGRLAQFGRSAITDVSNVFLGQFVDNLAQLLGNGSSIRADGAEPAAQGTDSAPSPAFRPSSDPADVGAVGLSMVLAWVRQPATAASLGLLAGLLIGRRHTRSARRDHTSLAALVAALAPQRP